MAAYDYRYGPQQQPALMQQHLEEPNYSGDVGPAVDSQNEQGQHTAVNGHLTNGYAPQNQMYPVQPSQAHALYDPEEHERHPTHDSGYGNGQTYSGDGAAMPKAPPPSKYAQPMQHPHNEPNYGPYQTTDFVQSSPKRLSSKWRKRLYWMVPLAIIGVAVVILFEVYKDDFLRWARPLEDWLRERQDWSWIIPVAILFILSFPPLFGHEIVQLIVGLVYPIGVALGIAIAGAILGEAGCFLLFKYGFTNYVRKKCDKDIKWATVARVSQQEGFKGVMIIRYSIIPPHLANPLFASTGMAFWLYMITVILSLPKQIVFVYLGNPANTGKTGAKVGKVIAIGVLVIITLAGSWYLHKKMAIARAEIEAERAAMAKQTEGFASQNGYEVQPQAGRNQEANGYAPRTMDTGAPASFPPSKAVPPRVPYDTRPAV